MNSAEILEDYCRQRALVGGLDRPAEPGRSIVVDLAVVRLRTKHAKADQVH